jgi:hypothetical protein
LWEGKNSKEHDDCVLEKIRRPLSERREGPGDEGNWRGRECLGLLISNGEEGEEKSL